MGQTIGEMVEAHIVGNGTTGAAFAASLGVTPAAVSRWRNGLQLPERHRLPDLATILGRPVAELREQWDAEDAKRSHVRAPTPAERIAHLEAAEQDLRREVTALLARTAELTEQIDELRRAEGPSSATPTGRAGRTRH